MQLFERTGKERYSLGRKIKRIANTASKNPAAKQLQAMNLFYSPTLPLITAKLAKKASEDGIKYMQRLEKKKISNYPLS